MMELSAGKLWGLRRLADPGGRFKMVAVDQRPPIKNLIAERRRAAEAPYEDVCAVKALLVRELAPLASAMLLDPHYAYPAAVALVRPSQGLVLTLEDSVFQEVGGGRLSKAIDDWNVAKIKRAGGDAVKVLAWYRPDGDAEVSRHQEDFVARVGDACRTYDLPFVLELLVYPLPRDEQQTKDYVEQRDKRPDLVLRSVETFADPAFGVDLFKLESPVAAAHVPDPESGSKSEIEAIQDLFDEMGRLVGRPWVMLSAGASAESFRRVLTFAYRGGASGYLAGRAIWWSAFQSFPDLERMERGLKEDAMSYMSALNRLTDGLAQPWTDHRCYGSGPVLAGSGTGFRQSYPAFGAGA